MEYRFSIKSKYFSLYQAFREEAEKVGWSHNTGFNPFTEEQSKWSNCLFFSSCWKGPGSQPMFSFSNSDINAYTLPEQWDAAIDHMKNIINDSLHGKVAVSLKDLAAQHGVEVEDIVITA